MTKAPLRLARTLRFLCDYFLGATLLVTAGYVIWILWLLVSPVIMKGSGQVATAGIWVGVGEGPPGLSLPVIMDLAESGVLPAAGLFKTTGELQFKTSDRRLQILGYLDNIVLSLLILGLVFMARQFLVEVIDGTPFTLENARRLKWIGWFLLGIGVAKPIVHNIAARWAFSIVKIQSPILSPPFDLDVAWILVSLFVLILSAVFRYGVELEKEHSLTV